MPEVLFAIESDQSRSPPLSAQRLVNLFTEKQHQGAKSQTPLFGAPGMDVYATAGDGPIRGFWVLAGVLYCVSGTSLYSVVGGVASEVGTGISGSGLVSMSDNGTQLIIVNGSDGWIYTTGGGLVQITAPAFEPANVVLFFDGYFVLNEAGTNEWFLSGLYDGTSYSGTDFASAESSPTPIVGFAKNLELLFIFKEDATELWYDAGNADFPFARYPGGVITRGCLATFSIVNQDGAVFFLGDDGIYYRMQGNVPIRVSTHSIEYQISQEATPNAITACTWTWQGHKFIAITLPTAKKTVVFDVSTGLWHDRESLDATSQSLGLWRINTAQDLHVGTTVFGDSLSGRIGVENWSDFTEFGNPMRAVAYSAPLHFDRKRVFVSRFELDVEAGVGNVDAPDPQIMLQWSKDGARTWSLLQPWRSLGPIGAYLTRLRWLRLGQGRQWVFAVMISDPVRRVIISAHMDVAVGL